MNPVIRTIGGTLALALLVVGQFALADEDKKEEKIKPEQLPKKVMDAVKAKFPKPEFTALTKETFKDGKIVYDLEFKFEGRKYEMDIAEDGTVLEVEREVFLKDLPKAISKAVEEKYPKSSIKEVMLVHLVKDNVEKPDHYEVTLETADKKTIEIEVSLDGKTVK
jgi:uncharacterized membrane protein YkoI